ncbi:DUF3060 domain-containing protein [Plantibacter flavus]|uniref:DUF3060 domain-containing protein n=1 Tax=Plantibacter flavus TaxID=150123 RepID=UPI003391F0CC
MKPAVLAAVTLALAGTLVACTSAPIASVAEPAVTQCTGRDVTIGSDGANVRLIGDCGAVTVRADAVTLHADSATSLTVDGDDNTISIDFVERVDVVGSGNDLTWLDGAELAEDAFPGNTLAPAQ